MLFTSLRILPSIPTLPRVFITHGYLIFSNTFSGSVEIMMQFFLFSLLTRWITLIGCEMLTQPLIPKTNHTWLWYRILFIYCWILFVSILLRENKTKQIKQETRPHCRSLFTFFSGCLPLFTSQILRIVTSLLFFVVYPHFQLESAGLLQLD